MLFLIFVWLSGFCYLRLHAEFCRALCYHVVVVLVLFSIVITSLGDERAGLCASRAIVCLFCTR